jgi:hypothetical protein
LVSRNDLRIVPLRRTRNNKPIDIKLAGASIMYGSLSGPSKLDVVRYAKTGIKPDTQRIAISIKGFISIVPKFLASFLWIATPIMNIGR